MVHSMVRKAWPMTAVKMKLVDTVMAWPVERVSSGWISLGTSHPSGPQLHAKPLVNIQTITMMAIAICRRAQPGVRASDRPVDMSCF